jgi:hypothetical protein
MHPAKKLSARPIHCNSFAYNALRRFFPLFRYAEYAVYA